MEFDLSTLTHEKAIKLLDAILRQLQEIDSLEGVQRKIGYHYLSKARKAKYYNGKSVLYGKRPHELLEKICEVYALSFDENTDSFITNTARNSFEWYIVYYFSQHLKKVTSGILCFNLLSNEVSFKTFFQKANTIRNEAEGKFKRKGQKLQFELHRTAQDSSFNSYHRYDIGTTPNWEPFYSGFYLVDNHVGRTIAGKAILERAENYDQAFEKVKAYVDERIEGNLLQAKPREPEKNVLPSSYDDFCIDKDLAFFVGNYRFTYVRGEGIIEDGVFSISINGKAKIDFKRGSKYIGYARITEATTLEVRLVQVSEKGQPFGAEVNIMAQVLRPITEPKVISAICLGRDGFRNPRAYHALLMMPETFGEKPEEQKFIDAYFGLVLHEKMTGMSRGEVQRFYKKVNE